VVLVKYSAPFGLEEARWRWWPGGLPGPSVPGVSSFKGGKGVATALGVLLGISGWLGLLVLLTWLAVASSSATPRCRP
jgi:glycerol-3-phosphate acyltransferase PlsY